MKKSAEETFFFMVFHLLEQSDDTAAVPAD